MRNNSLKVLTDAVDALSLPSDSRILVATSGGPDSVALALAFHARSLQPGTRWELRLAHVNHCLRGADSDEDEAFVRGLAQRLSLGVDLTRVDTTAHATANRQSLETAARELRYDALRRMLRAWDGDVIAVGHHLDDQAETVIMNLTRGAGLDGLSGMQARSGEVIRPFLRLSKETIMAALAEAGETYRIDSSNLDPGPRRNRVRHRLLPVMKEINPDIHETIARTASLLGDDAEYLNTEAAQALPLMDVHLEPRHLSAAAGVLRALHPAVQGRILRLLVGALKGDARDLAEEHVELMRQAVIIPRPESNLGSQLPHHLRFERTGDRFHIFLGEPESVAISASAYLPIPGEVEVSFGRFSAMLVEPDMAETLSYALAVSGPQHAFCDADALGDQLLVRSRKPGDRLSLLHSAGSRKLQDLFIDAKIPRRERDRIPVLARAEHLVWVPGFGLDRRVAIHPDTKRVAHLRFRAFL